MKNFFKITLVLALSLMVFSCSKEETTSSEDTSIINDKSFIMKNGGLTDIEVKNLTDSCVMMSNSAAFKIMRAKSSEFTTKMNYNVDSSWTKRDEIELWLNSNVSLTKFATAQEGLDLFDELSSASQTVYDNNTYLFKSLGLATDPQLTIILQPIQPTFPALPQPTMDCMDLCVWVANNSMDFAMSVFNFTLKNIEMNNSMTYNQGAAIAAASAACDDAIEEAYQTGLACLDACPD